jgi:hypothetical protein
MDMEVWSMKRHFAVLAFTALTAVPGFASTRVYVKIGPPVAVVEKREVAPSARHVWIPGFHRWDGNTYVWVSGRWEVPPKGRHAWVPGHWVHHHRNGYYWVEGHWR